MKTALKRQFKKRLKQRDATRRFAVEPEWEKGEFWSGYDDDERQAILRDGHILRKRQKITSFAKYVDVADFEYFYATNHAFRAFVDRVRGAKGDFGCGLAEGERRKYGAYKARKRE